jgi:hypothetical protein
MNKRVLSGASVLLIGFVLAGSLQGFSETVIRVGAFPNITHAQPMVGKATERRLWHKLGLAPPA